jgi:hypothetical protein
MSDPAAIPYERQSDTDGTRSCGAACLSMVYRSLGKDVPQTEIWPVIAKPNRFGAVSSTTYLMAQDAINRGFRAVALQARHPLQTLRLCRESGVRAILNHRPQVGSSTGHYSVLVDVTDRDAVLHDPADRPLRRVSHDQLLELWQPRSADSEISGFVLIAIAAPKTSSARSCEFCHVPFPAGVECPRCRKQVRLLPDEPLGCANTACIARMWNYICCPYCDQAFMFTAGASASPGASPHPSAQQTGASSPASPSDPLNFDPLFAKIDKFSAFIMGLPGVADRPDIQHHLDLVKQQKEKLTLAKMEALARQASAADQMAIFEQSLKEKKEAHAKRMEELNVQAPPLDGNALGHALLKSIGFVD